MEMRMHGRRRGPVFFRIVSYFLLLLIPTVVVGTATYFVSVRRIRAELGERAKLNLEAAVESVDKTVQRAQELSVNLFRDRFLRSILRPSEALSAEQRAELSGVAETLARHRAIAGPAVHNLFLYLDDARVYEPFGADGFDWFFSRFYVHEGLPLETWRSFLEHPEGATLLAVTTVRMLHENTDVSVLPVVSVGLLEGNKAVAVVNVAMHVVAQELESRKPVDSAVYDVYDAAGDRILSSGANAEGNTAERSGHSTFSRRSIMLGWDYRMSIPNSELRAYSAGILRVTLFLSCVIMAIGILASLALAARLYAPIEGIRDILLTSSQGARGGGRNGDEDDFQLIRGAVSTLIESSAASHRQDSLSELLWYLLQAERVVDGDTLSSVSRAAGFEHPAFAVASLQVMRTHPIDSTELDRRIRAATPLFLEAWRDVALVQALYGADGYAVVILNVPGDCALVELIARARSIAVDRIGSDPQGRVVVGIGCAVASLQSVSRSHSEALALVRRGLRGIDPLAFGARPPDVFHFPFDVERSLLDLAHQGAIVRIQSAVRGIVEYNLANDISQIALCALMQEIAFAASRSWDEHTQGRQPVDEALLRRASAVEWRPDGYRPALEAAIALWSDVAARWNRRSGVRDGVVLHRVSRYVDSHFSDPTLCVRQLGEALGLSDKYLSRRFMEETGERLSDYVRVVRVGKAKELLKSERIIRIEDVAEAVGISSRATFDRVFRKETGMTPSDYRARSSFTLGKSMDII